MSTSTRATGTPQLSSLARVRIRYRLRLHDRGQHVAALRNHADDFAARLLRVRPELATLSSAPPLQRSIHDFERDLREGIQAIHRDELERGGRKLQRAEVLLAEVECYAEALQVIRSARSALDRSVADWNEGRYGQCPTLRGLARALDPTALTLLRDGSPRSASEIAHFVTRELVRLAEGSGHAAGAPCRACVDASILPEGVGEHLGHLRDSGRVELARLLQCELAAQRTLRVRRLSETGARSHLGELTQWAANLAEQARRQADAWTHPRSSSDLHSNLVEKNT